MKLSDWHPLWDTLNAVAALALGGALVVFVVTGSAALYRRLFVRKGTFGDHYRGVVANARRKVEAEEAEAMERCGSQLWKPGERTND